MSTIMNRDNELLMKIYLDRSNNYVYYRFKYVHDGWHFDLVEMAITSDRNAIEFLEYLRRRDQLSYPVSIGVYFEGLWNDIYERQISNNLIQDKIDLLCKWISDCERNKPQL